jgi:hypothetical protein
VNAVKSVPGVGECGRDLFSLAACSLQIAKAGSAATRPQQEKNNSAGVQRGSVHITGFISPTHTRTEGRSPVWGSEFTTKAATPQGVFSGICCWVKMKDRASGASCESSPGNTTARVTVAAEQREWLDKKLNLDYLT